MPLPTISKEPMALAPSYVRDTWNELVNNLVFDDDVAEALQSYRYLAWLIEEAKKSASLEEKTAAAEYERLARLLAACALPALSEQEVEEFLRTHATVALLHPDIDLWQKIEAKLVRIYVFEERDPFKQKLRAALAANDEPLTEVTLQEGERRVLGTVGNWTGDYQKAVGGGRASTLIKTTYITSSLNTKGLKDADRGKVKKLIDVYKQLKISSMEAGGIEEDYVFERNGKLEVFRKGRAEEVRDKKTEEVLARMKQKEFFAYPNLPLIERVERFKKDQTELIARARRAFSEPLPKEVASELEKLKTTAQSTQLISDICYDAALPGPGKGPLKNKALAALVLLAQRGALDMMLGQSEKWRAFYEEYLRGQGKDAALEGFKIQPSAPQYAAQFLRALLIGALKMTEAESAKFASRLGNLMKSTGKPQYFGMAYFDAQLKMFVWKL